MHYTAIREIYGPYACPCGNAAKYSIYETENHPTCIEGIGEPIAFCCRECYWSTLESHSGSKWLIGRTNSLKSFIDRFWARRKKMLKA